MNAQNKSKAENTKFSTKELLILGFSMSILFAISGMDFIGYFFYIFTRLSSEIIYTRSLVNVLLGFMITTISLFFIPLIIVKKHWKKPISQFGSQFGNKKTGIIIILIFLLFTPIFFFSSKDQNLINTYPLTKDILSSWVYFVLYEILYVIFYYIPYEFFFRGILQMGLNKKWDYWYSILFVTVLTTLLHITKPISEILSAAFAGILFGLIAKKTESWYYVFVIHIIVGISTDIFCGLRHIGVI